jgi:perosamine synthetase
MVVTNDETLFDRTVHFKGQGLAKHREYWHDVIGYNYRMTNICAAIGLAQLEVVENTIKVKREIAEFYKKNLTGIPVEVHKEHESKYFNTYWMVSILVENPGLREKLREHLAANGIETRPTFYPVHTMPMYSEKFQRHPVAENLGWRGINLPSYPELTEKDVIYICNEIKEFYSGRK